LRAGDLNRSAITAKGYDSDNTFMVVEFAGDQMNFQTISRTGQTVDSGTIVRQAQTSSATLASPKCAVSVSAKTPVLRSGEVWQAYITLSRADLL
jgi:hypothetical protein